MKNYVGVVGLDIVLNTGITITGADDLKIKYQKPDGTTGEWTATASGTTSVKYTTADGDIDQAGAWTFQAYAEVSGGKFHGETAEIIFSALFDESAFTDLVKVKAMIGMTVDQTDDDNILQTLILQSTKKIQNYTRRSLFYGSYTEYYDGRLGSAIFVNNAPIVSVTSVHDDTDRVFGSDTLVPATDYFADENAGIIRLLDDLVFNHGFGNVKVVYYGGYKVIPKDLELACSQLVIADYIELKGTANVLEGDTVIYKPSNLRKEAYATLDLYKKVSLF